MNKLRTKTATGHDDTNHEPEQEEKRLHVIQEGGESKTTPGSYYRCFYFLDRKAPQHGALEAEF